MIVIIIILIYFILYFSNKKVYNVLNTKRLKITKTRHYIFDLIIIILFFILYIIIIRLLRLFLTVKVRNLNLMKNNFIYFYEYYLNEVNIIVIIIIMIFSIKLSVLIKNIIIQRLKISFMRLNYFHINSSEKYFTFYIKIVSWQNLFWYWITIDKFKLHKKIFFKRTNTIILYFIYFFFKFIGITILIFSFIYDIFYHNTNLVFLLNILPLFALYQTLYKINFFLNNDLNCRFDAYCSDYLYPPQKYSELKIDYKIIIKISKYLEDIIKI